MHRSIAAVAPMHLAAPLSLALVLSGLGPGGTERVVSLLASYWAALGWRVHLLSLDGDEIPPYFPLDSRVAVRRLGLLAESSGLLDASGRTLCRLRTLRAAFRCSDADLVLSFGDRTNVLALLACIGLRLPVVVSERTDPTRHDIGRAWNLARRWIYPRAAAVTTQTQAALFGLRGAVAGQAVVIPNPIEALPAPPAANRPRTIIGVGRLTKEKGFDLLIEAFARIARTHPAWDLVIHGEGPERPKLEQLADRHGLEPRISLPGVTPAPGAWITAAGVFALPSRYEGFPNALAEALAAGLPAVAFDCGSGPSEIVCHDIDGLLVPAEDVGALAVSLDRLLSDADLRLRLGSHARDAMQRFAPGPIMSRWTELARAVAQSAT